MTTRAASYPWNPTDEELCNTVAESEKEFEKGHYITQNELKSKLQKKIADNLLINKRYIRE
ncbi:MAG: hypothetical protein LUD46_06985 [Parabacteroides sp.]|nr:hypothetical protein [Parabacteroides sp.]